MAAALQSKYLVSKGPMGGFVGVSRSLEGAKSLALGALASGSGLITIYRRQYASMEYRLAQEWSA